MSAPKLENVADIYGLSPMQEGMLFHTISAPGSGVFVDQIALDLVGDLDPSAFRNAWARLIERHTALRTALLWDGLDQPLQIVRERVEIEVVEHDWASLDDSEREERWQELLAADRTRGFDLSDAPLMRMALIQLGQGSWRWLWSFHHLIADGWSAQVLLGEFLSLYGAVSAELPSPVPYRDFIAWLAKQDQSSAERFWRERLTGFETPHKLESPDGPEPPGIGYGEASFELDEATTASLRAMATAERVTLNTAMLGAWSLLLGRWTREPDVVFGVTTSGRPPDLPGAERAVGLFINTLPVRVGVPAEARLGDWLRGIQKAQTEQRDYEQTSLAAVQRWSDAPAGDALFESIFVFENYPPASRRMGSLEIRDMRFFEQSNYPLAVLVEPRDRLKVTLVYDEARFDREWIGRLGGWLTALAEQFGSDGGRALGEFDLAGPQERLQLCEWNSGPALEPGVDECIHHLIARTAERRPEAVAAADENGSLTYAELETAAEGVADRLRNAGVGPGKIVGLHIGRSTVMIAGLLGILKSGAAYAPLDPAYPEAHIRLLLEGGEIATVLTTQALRDRLPTGMQAVTIDGPPPSPSAPASREPTPDDFAYIIHTSGSTGRPNGVTVTHRNLVYSTRARIAYYGEPVGRFLLLSSFAFDSSVAGIFWTLCSGGALILPGPGVEQDLDRLLELAASHQATHLLALPTLYALMLEHPRRDALDSLEVAIVAGEACGASTAQTHFERRPKAKLYNEYGPTEGTVWCTVHEIVSSEEPVPIGKPIPGAEVYLLDVHGRPAPVGVAGEIHIGGPGVAPGYLNQPELSAERFVWIEVDGERRRVYRTGDLARYRSDGALMFLGRVDEQIKIRGHRIEIGAVESALRRLPAASDAVAAARPGPGGRGKRLIGYVEVAEPLDPTALREALAADLPEHMIPDLFVVLPALPRLPNGKADRKSLPDPRDRAEADRAARVAPRTDAERTLQQIWSTLLGVEKVGVHDNYFALGGDSITSIQLVSRARQAGLQLDPGQVARFPTIAALAEAVQPSQAEPAERGPEEGAVPLGPIQRWFFDQSHPAPHHWNQSNLFEVPADIDPRALDEALRDCVARHDMLRARFVQTGDEWRQTIGAPSDEPLLEVHHLGDADEQQVLAQTQAGIDLGRRPFRVALLRRGGGRPALLLWAVHHLVVDVVSWTILMDDLEAAYLSRAAGRPFTPPARTAPFREWIGKLEQTDWKTELAYWAAPVPAVALPADHQHAGTGSEATAEAVRVELDEERTARLLTDANDAYRTRAPDLLLTALARAVARRTGSKTLRIALEGHGRVNELGCDLSRTVGWFSAVYPVTLEAHADLDSAIKATKECLRAVPRGGVGYGVLRYLQRRPEFTAQPTPPVLFNFLGRAASRRSQTFRWVSSEEATSRAPENPRGHPLEVVASVRDGRLTVDWQYSTALHNSETIERLADDFVGELGRILDHCTARGAGGFTPSDFPELGLDQSALQCIESQTDFERAHVEALLPLLPLQQALLIARDRNPSADPGFLQVRFTLDGTLDPDRLRRAWEQTVRARAALRMSTLDRDQEDPLLIVRKDVPAPWTSEDWRDRDAKTQRRDLSERLAADRSRGLDPRDSPAMRLAVMRVADDRHEVLWTCHHLFVDGWSAAIVLDDWMRCYALAGESSFEDLRDLRAFYRWANRRDDAETEAFWRERLAGFRGAPSLSLGEGPKGKIAAIERALEPALPGRIAALCAAESVTPNAVVQGAWALLLARWLGREDVVFGATVSGRAAPIDGVARLVGYLANVVPVRAHLDRAETAADLMRRLRDEQFAMQAHEHALLADIQGWSDLPARRALLETLLVVENFPAQTTASGEVALRNFRSDLTTVFPLTVAVVTDAAWTVRCRYDRAACSADVLTTVLESFERLLGALAATPERSIGEILDEVALDPIPEQDDGRCAASVAPPGDHEGPRDEIELHLVRIWEETLGVSPVRIYEDYFALGGTSIAAVRLFARIEQVFGKSLPLSSLLHASTVAAMANKLRAPGVAETEWRSLVSIQAGGSRVPIACVHAGGANVLFYRDLARRLGPDQPVYGLEPVGLDGLEPPLESIQQMANRYVDELRSVQPAGPYRLVGYCVGGAVCLEMARRLESLGEPVDLLVMVDSGLPWELARAVTPFAQARRALKVAGVAGVREGLENRIRGWARRAWALTFGDADARRLVYHERVEEACRRAFGRYHAAPCQAPITLIRSSEYAREEEKERHLDWGRYAPHLDVHVVEAQHFTILAEPEVRRVAEVIHRQLEAVDAAREEPYSQATA